MRTLTSRGHRAALAVALSGALAAAALTAVGAAGPASAASASGDDRRIVVHTVRAGETATELAVRYHAWTAELIAHNHLGSRAHLQVGQRLEIPVVVSAERRARRSEGAERRSRAGADVPRERVRRTIAHHAHRAGVDPDLALAVAWQESGWQMDVISSAGAIGAMQVLPTTGEWMKQYTGHGMRLRRLRGNAIAGTTLLRVLGDNTCSQRRQVAAYYQGLGAVQEHGLYGETKPYVRNVLAIRKRLERGLPPS